MLSSISIPQAQPVFGGVYFPYLSSSPLGGVIFVNSATGADSRGRLKFFPATAVSKGTTQGPVGDPSYPLATVFGTNGALSYCSAGRGDIIVVLNGHTENLSNNSAYSIPASVTIVGVGYGQVRPTFTVTGGTATAVALGAASQINNCIFDLTGVASVVKGFTMAAGSQINMCRIIQASSTNQAANAITVNGADAQILNTEIDATAATGGLTAIASGAAVARLLVSNCYIHGQYGTALFSSTGSNHITEMLLEFNTLVQRNGTAKNIFNFTTSSTGVVSNNDLVGTTWSSAADAIANSSSTSLRWLQNFGFDDGAGVVSGVLVPAAGTIA